MVCCRIPGPEYPLHLDTGESCDANPFPLQRPQECLGLLHTLQVCRQMDQHFSREVLLHHLLSNSALQSYPGLGTSSV